MRTGTSYFVDYRKAVKYYKSQGYEKPMDYVDMALREGSIHIGQPRIKEGESLIIIDNGTRYAIETPEGPKPLGDLVGRF